MNFNLLPHELIIDNFAGGGGTSTGLEQAFNRPVDVAINHDPKALAMHRMNHPNTKHYCESVWDIDPIEVTGNQPVGLVWLSPDCKHFSKAKGGKPVEKKIRGLAWIALRWAAKTRPRVIMLENVEEFKTWGRVAEDGKPCPKYKGETFRSFVKALRYQGYTVEWRVLRACDYGAPTIRKRFFLIARRDGLPISWPIATHGDPKDKGVQKGLLKPYRTAAECIDWSIECPSIFDRKRPLVDATLKRIFNGLDKFLFNCLDPFVVDGSVVPVLTECANATSPRTMATNEPLRTICAQVKGGHHALISAHIAKNYTGVIGSSVNEPVHTVTAKDHNSLVVSHLSKLRNNCVGQSIKEPMHTITAGGGHFAEVRAFLTAFYGNEKNGNSLYEPLRTIPTRDRFGLVTINNQAYQVIDIGFRMLQPVELFRAQGFPDSYIFEKGLDETGNEIKLTKTEQTRMVGNSVCPQLARALVEANFSHEKKYRGAA
ncbi:MULTISPECIES: DNA cytosine methyltransferase [Acinetobacter]|uniref:DNA cytosine methyltransferase n=1 Tax=Acinetobacter TaxID=469 RepID=UPI000EA0B51F|nr:MULTISPECIES: DNA cytosine methyltransferase [Acinetobacter]RKG43807.1 DNA cytosine methyltransferase [Acinetobacter cumulans]RZG59522.1 DNA cytosine methyltransferase [Acinetobacter sp. WCHAc060006]